MPAIQPRQRFRQYLEGDIISYPISVFDPVSARIARHLGDLNWYLPRWLQWIPTIRMEEGGEATSPAETVSD